MTGWVVCRPEWAWAGPDTGAAGSGAGSRLDLTTQLLQITGALAVVIVIILAAAMLLRRLSPVSAGNKNLRVLASLSVGQRERVVVLQVGDRQVLIGVSPGRVQTLHVFDEPLSFESRGERSDSFSGKLATMIKQGSVQ